MMDIQARAAGERRVESAMLGLLCGVSIGRGALTGIVPACGASAWWVTALCLLPGFLVTALLAGMMRLTHSPTWTEAFRRAWGMPGAWLTAGLLAALLLIDGVSSITVLTTLFTQGIGTRGTQLTLAVLTGVLLLCSLHREGLARGIFLLRWGMAAAVCIVAACLLPQARMDRLFPLCGEGRSALFDALKSGAGLGWPMVLFLCPQGKGGRGGLRRAGFAAMAAAAVILLLNLTIPHEVILADTRLSAMLLLPLRFAPNALRVVGASLMMLALFLSMGASVQLAARSLCMPIGREPRWLPYALVGVLVASQGGDLARLWRWLGQVSPCMLAALLACAVLLLPGLNRRKRG